MVSKMFSDKNKSRMLQKQKSDKSFFICIFRFFFFQISLFSFFLFKLISFFLNFLESFSFKYMYIFSFSNSEDSASEINNFGHKSSPAPRAPWADTTLTVYRPAKVW